MNKDLDTIAGIVARYKQGEFHAAEALEKVGVVLESRDPEIVIHVTNPAPARTNFVPVPLRCPRCGYSP